MTRLRLGVIGTGSWVMASHLPNFQRHADEIEFVIVNRRTPELLAQAKQVYRFARALTDWRDVIAERCDIVVVTWPAALHHEHARAALESGALVLCDKPFTIDPAQARDLVDTERRVGRSSVIPFGWNHRPMTQAAKRLMDEDRRNPRP